VQQTAVSFFLASFPLENVTLVELCRLAFVGDATVSRRVIPGMFVRSLGLAL